MRNCIDQKRLGDRLELVPVGERAEFESVRQGPGLGRSPAAVAVVMAICRAQQGKADQLEERPGS
jgi:hypothetical protein